MSGHTRFRIALAVAALTAVAAAAGSQTDDPRATATSLGRTAIGAGLAAVAAPAIRLDGSANARAARSPHRSHPSDGTTTLAAMAGIFTLLLLWSLSHRTPGGVGPRWARAWPLASRAPPPARLL
jgi:hypothetical protein